MQTLNFTHFLTRQRENRIKRKWNTLQKDINHQQVIQGYKCLLQNSFLEITKSRLYQDKP